MPPRTTRKSYRPRVSDRTMVGTSPPPRLLASEAESIVTITMDLQKEKARASQHYVGWRARRRPSSFQSQRQCFHLTLPFIERGNRRSSFFRRNSADFTLRISRPRIRRQEHHRQAYSPCHFRKEEGLRRASFRWAERA